MLFSGGRVFLLALSATGQVGFPWHITTDVWIPAELRGACAEHQRRCAGSVAKGLRSAPLSIVGQCKISQFRVIFRQPALLGRMFSPLRYLTSQVQFFCTLCAACHEAAATTAAAASTRCCLPRGSSNSGSSSTPLLQPRAVLLCVCVCASLCVCLRSVCRY